MGLSGGDFPTRSFTLNEALKGGYLPTRFYKEHLSRAEMRQAFVDAMRCIEQLINENIMLSTQLFAARAAASDKEEDAAGLRGLNALLLEELSAIAPLRLPFGHRARELSLLDALVDLRDVWAQVGLLPRPALARRAPEGVRGEEAGPASSDAGEGAGRGERGDGEASTSGREGESPARRGGRSSSGSGAAAQSCGRGVAAARLESPEVAVLPLLEREAGWEASLPRRVAAREPPAPSALRRGLWAAVEAVHGFFFGDGASEGDLEWEPSDPTVGRKQPLDAIEALSLVREKEAVACAQPAAVVEDEREEASILAEEDECEEIFPLLDEDEDDDPSPQAVSAETPSPSGQAPTPFGLPTWTSPDQKSVPAEEVRREEPSARASSKPKSVRFPADGGELVHVLTQADSTSWDPQRRSPKGCLRKPSVEERRAEVLRAYWGESESLQVWRADDRC